MLFVTWLLLSLYVSVVTADKRLEYMLMDQTCIGHVFDNTSVDTAMKCCAVCTSNTVCASVSFNSHNRTCQLNDHNPYDYPEADVALSTAWTSFMINIVPCSSGWVLYNRRCYLVVTSEDTWADAEDNCQSLNSHLVDIRDDHEVNFVINAVTSTMGKAVRFWIGLNDLVTDETYVYTSGASVTYTSYANGEPSLFAGAYQEDCIEIMDDKEWNDEMCSKLQVSVCEKIHY